MERPAGMSWNKYNVVTHAFSPKYRHTGSTDFVLPNNYLGPILYRNVLKMYFFYTYDMSFEGNIKYHRIIFYKESES